MEEIMNSATRERPRSVEEFGAMMEGLAPSPELVETFWPLDPDSTDVVITPFGKCGTTLLQQMFHQLRMAQGIDAKGDLDFDDISRIVPWIEMAILIPEVDINGPQKVAPRGFKSHLHYEGLPPGMRYVISLRDPKEAYMSMYNFFEGWLFEPGTIQPEEFMPIWMTGGPSRVDYFAHLLSWWARRDAEDTLLMSYRWIIANKREAIARLAAFCRLKADAATVDLVEAYTERAFMLEHKHLFDDHLMRHMNNRRIGLAVEAESSKVRAEGESQRLIPHAIAAEIDAIWAERVAPVTGHADFAALSADLHA